MLRPRPRGMTGAEALAVGTARHGLLLENGGDLIAAIRRLGDEVIECSEPKVLLAVHPGRPFVIEA